MSMRSIGRAALAFGCALLCATASATTRFVVSSNNGALLRFDGDGQYLDSVIGAANGLLGAPQHMAKHGDRILVAGWSNHLVSAVDVASGEVVAQWGLPDAINPAFLRLSPDGEELWVSFLNSHRIVRLDPEDGTVLGDLVPAGSIAGPHCITALPDGDLLVSSSDDWLYRVRDGQVVGPVLQVPRTNGRPLMTLLLDDGDTLLVTSFVSNTQNSLRKYSLSSGADLGRFSETQGTQADGLLRGPDDRIYVVFFGTPAVMKYDLEGNYLGSFAVTNGTLGNPNAVMLLQHEPTAVRELETGWLRGVQPNPFSARTALRFDLPQAARLQVSVYDLAGRRVRTLHAGDAPAGPGELVWDGLDETGRGVAAGVYFLRLASAGVGQAERVVKLR